MIWSRREWLLAAAAAAGCSPRKTAAGCDALAGTTIRWIVPFGDGGSHEVYSRLIEPLYEETLGAEIIVVTEPGNGGIVGSTKLRDAAPDGRTIGILNAPGLFGASLVGQASFPNPARDFSILGRLGRSRPVLSVAASSPLRTVGDLLERQKARPIATAVSGLASNSLLVMAVCEHLLGLRVDYIAGLSGSRENVLAILRGDTDIMASNFDSVQQAVNQGDLRLLLQIAEEPISDDPSVRNVPCLGGAQGWATRRALEVGKDSEEAVEGTRALIELTGIGIVAAAPRGLPADLLDCLRTRLFDAASSSRFRSAALAALRLPDVATGEQVQRDLSAAEQHVERFAPIVRAAFSRARK